LPNAEVDAVGGHGDALATLELPGLERERTDLLLALIEGRLRAEFSNARVGVGDAGLPLQIDFVGGRAVIAAHGGRNPAADLTDKRGCCQLVRGKSHARYSEGMAARYGEPLRGRAP